MTDDNKRANIAAELDRSRESLQAARVLIDSGLFRDAESRVYYAALHAVKALLLTEGLDPRSHAAVAQRLGLHFIKTGRLEPGDGRLFARLQKYRLEADYSVEFVLTREALEEDFAGCGAFVERARALIALMLA